NCHPTFCGMLVEVEDGKLKTVSGDKDNPDSQGFLRARPQHQRDFWQSETTAVPPDPRGSPLEYLAPRELGRGAGFHCEAHAGSRTRGCGPVGGTWWRYAGWCGHDPADAAVLRYLWLSKLAPSNDLLGARRLRRGPDRRAQGQHQGGHG